jgi:hypothetical protein
MCLGQLVACGRSRQWRAGADQTVCLTAGQAVRDLVNEYEARESRESPEVRLARTLTSWNA